MGGGLTPGLFFSGVGGLFVTSPAFGVSGLVTPGKDGVGPFLSADTGGFVPTTAVGNIGFVSVWPGPDGVFAVPNGVGGLGFFVKPPVMGVEETDAVGWTFKAVVRGLVNAGAPDTIVSDLRRSAAKDC